MTLLRTFLAAIACLALAAQAALADQGVCACCGCCASVESVCVPKKTEKTITKVCWDYKCEEVCIPGRSCKLGSECREDACGCWSFNIWEPGCARVKTRTVPVRTEVKRKVPSVQWVVEKRCAACCQNH